LLQLPPKIVYIHKSPMKETKSPTDNELIDGSLNGSKQCLETLIERYNDYIFNVSYKMLWNTEDAKDVTQEILITVITKLDSFKRESAFKTWLYRITKNHILNFIKSRGKTPVFSFQKFGENLDNAPDFELEDRAYNTDNQLLVEEVKQTCMSGMLMCLDDKSRMVFVLGELLGINDKVGSQIMETTPENFRMLLSRAKKQLYSFMTNKCGLINKNNPCRCSLKTKAFVNAGYVNPGNLLFAPQYQNYITQVATEKQAELEGPFYEEYRQLYQQHTFMSNKTFAEELKTMLTSDKIKSLFNFN